MITKKDTMLSQFLDYYLFEYEIQVYSDYTHLTQEMISKKMNIFQKFVKTFKRIIRIETMMGCFYDENNKDGVCILFGKNSFNEHHPPIQEFKNNKVPFDLESTMGTTVICLPYYLFRNDKLKPYLSHANKEKENNYWLTIYSKLHKNGIDFIWRQPFKIRKNISKKIDSEKRKFMKDYGVAETYQQLYCLLISKDDINANDLNQLGDAFALSIKEWGLDILRNNAIEHGTRAAVAAIMGRNMSHNIGSHVLSRLSEKEFSEQEQDLTRAKDLFRYLQQRMDFIAQISTTNPSWTLDVKWNDILDEFVKQEFILDNIAKFKDLDKSSIKLKYNKKDSRSVAIPTGLVGCHALYSIFENIIRNAAKYGFHKSSRRNSLIFDVKIENHNADFYRVLISDNCSNATKDIITGLNKMFKEEVIDDKGQLIGKFWGIKEKKISASYLRLLPTEKIDSMYLESLKSDVPIIKCKKTGKNLKYEFFLMKPKKALIVSSYIPKQIGTFNDYGIYFLQDVGQLKNYIDQKSINHKFIIFDHSAFQQLRRLIKDSNDNNFMNYLPIRCVEMDTGIFRDPENLYLSIWKKWLSIWNKKILGKNIVVRWSYFKKDIQDAGYIKIEETVNSGYKGFIIFDHRTQPDDSQLFKEASFHVPFSAEDGLGALLRSDVKQLKLLRYEFLEATTTRIAVVDNRIWEEGQRTVKIKKYKNDSAQIKYAWEKMGVTFYDHSIVIDDFGSFVKSIKGNIYKFIIFHQGEIDEIKKVDKEFDNNWKTLKSKVSYVIIVTGRGVPEQAKDDDLRWVQYALLQNYLIDQIKGQDIGIAKYNLIQLLFSLRRE